MFFSDQLDTDPRLPNQLDRLGWAIVGDVGMSFLDGGRTAADASVSLAVWRRLADRMGLENVELEQATTPGFHPGRTARISLDGHPIGHVGELNPSVARGFDLEGRVAVAELDLAPILSPVAFRIGKTPSLLPHVDFDLSFLVPADMPVADVVSATTTAADNLVEQVKVFDEYTGETLEEGTKAVAIRYRIRHPENTLTAEDVAHIRNSMIEAASNIGAALRGL